jgi:hypothetical protein
MAAVGVPWLFAFGAEALLATDHQYSDPSLYTTPMVLVTALAFVLAIPTAAAVITWLFRCCRNLPALGVRGSQCTREAVHCAAGVAHARARKIARHFGIDRSPAGESMQAPV